MQEEKKEMKKLSQKVVRKFLDRNEMSLEDFSNLVEISIATAHKLAEKGHIPRRIMAHRIERKTGGQITMGDFGYQ